MVGAKAFAIGQKVAPKRLPNPILTKINNPRVAGLGKEDTKEMDKMLEGNNTQAQPFKLFDKINSMVNKPKNPIISKVLPSNEEEKPDNNTGQHKTTGVESRSSIDLPKVELSKQIDATTKGIKEILAFLKTSKTDEDKKDNRESFSEELIDHLSCQVFENIKNYLGNNHHMDRSMGNKHIKIELNI